MKFDVLVEHYLSLYTEEENSAFTPSNQAFIHKFERDIKRINGNPQLKSEVKSFFNKWDSGELSPTFELKFQSKNTALKESLKEIGIDVNQFPLFVVEVRTRRPAVHLLCTKIADRVIWLRAFLGYDEYHDQLNYHCR